MSKILLCNACHTHSTHARTHAQAPELSVCINPHPIVRYTNLYTASHTVCRPSRTISVHMCASAGVRGHACSAACSVASVRSILQCKLNGCTCVLGMAPRVCAHTCSATIHIFISSSLAASHHARTLLGSPHSGLAAFLICSFDHEPFCAAPCIAPCARCWECSARTPMTAHRCC
jgi:hypothetical protein